MQLSFVILAAAGTALAAPQLAPRQNACFVVGNSVLPQEVSDAVTSLQNKVTCDTSKTTIGKVPDVDAGGVTFSSINFANAKGQTPLAFALEKFATTEPLASNDLTKFQNELDAYVATEAGIRSTGGNLAIKVPKFFLSMQVQRIATAQGNPPKAAGQQVDHLRDKVLKNAPKENKALLDQVTALAAKLS
ncbi:hypothetical protein CMUS01_08853 [Colletotrichum musicola]|uniref:DUF7143 domain-containing protein n=2 Tax=Colletotrichum orchidearum species complex TaxID=2707337 RepID=A0A8H6KAM7_9PEZI|nr:hypothetical protein CMUS01_08853 [Colletotrichum musicola]KAF6835543.1 hypothetical protein CPLU01_04219 [Colletotrichum plurivorum]